MTLFIVFAFLLIAATPSWADGEELGILFPQNSETREMTSLDGLWRFYVETTDSEVGWKFKQNYRTRLIDKPAWTRLETDHRPAYNSIHHKSLIYISLAPSLITNAIYRTARGVWCRFRQATTMWSPKASCAIMSARCDTNGTFTCPNHGRTKTFGCGLVL